MKKIADLYVRVSTDEQADKGYSQRNQEEMLRKFCGLNNIQIRDVIYEDYSAKTFNRPQWKKILLNLRRYKNKTDLILFTKWDRFSRNAGDAYQMINLLRKLGVEPQAIEQPLDLSIPENKMMLAFYLAAPEVENDRRALNTMHGMRRAKKEGRYMGIAPFGYMNKTKDDGRKFIMINEKQAIIVRWAFHEIAKKTFNTESVYYFAKKKGLTLTKSGFWVMLKNPLYCGKIFVPKYKDEIGYFVRGQHEAIISEELFYEVQDVLDGRARVYRPKIETIDEFPLRGFFLCPKCSKKLTASKCKGRSKYYYYYHCESSCKYRINSEEANEKFISNLNIFAPVQAVKKLYTSLILESYNSNTSVAKEEKSELLTQITNYEKRLSNARELLVTEQIDSDDYQKMKSEYGQIINRLEIKLNNISDDKQSVEGLLNMGIDRLIQLNFAYTNANLSEARDLIGLIYPENFTFRNNQFQTARVNEVAGRIYLINSELCSKKNETKEDFSSLSRKVTSTGFKPVTF
ncbi:MAG: recombinase family protein [Flavobacteriales bacterium 32-34-25]|nr:MAG: recombinase family protein [Flavobacteriales bacterium 32-34-25]